MYSKVRQHDQNRVKVFLVFLDWVNYLVNSYIFKTYPKFSITTFIIVGFRASLVISVAFKIINASCAVKIISCIEHPFNTWQNLFLKVL